MFVGRALGGYAGFLVGWTDWLGTVGTCAVRLAPVVLRSSTLGRPGGNQGARRRPGMASHAVALRRTADDPVLRRLQLGLAFFSLAEYGGWLVLLVYAFDHGGTTEAGLVAFATASWRRRRPTGRLRR